MRTTRFEHKSSQAVIIPEEFRFDAKHAEIEREGEPLLITPIPDNKGWPEGYIESILANAADETFFRHPQGEHREINL